MKRGEMTSPRSPAHKKPKLSDPEVADDHREQDDEGWTKVERRKGKKKKIVKLDMPTEVR